MTLAFRKQLEMIQTAVPLPVKDLKAARNHVMGFACPEGFSEFSWKQLQHTALTVWHAHLSQRPFRGSLHFCRPEFYEMIRNSNGDFIVPIGLIRRYQAA